MGNQNNPKWFQSLELNRVYAALDEQAETLDAANERAREWEAKVKGA